jgi:hypothetical protein
LHEIRRSVHFGSVGIDPARSGHGGRPRHPTNQGATPGVRELAAAFSRASGHKVTVIQADDAVLQQRLNDGTADLITGNPGPIDELVRNGKVVAGTVTPFVRAGLGLSVRAGAPKPDISTVEAYKATLLAAKSIGYSRGCSGTNIAEGIEQLGLTEQMNLNGYRPGFQRRSLETRFTRPITPSTRILPGASFPLGSISTMGTRIKRTRLTTRSTSL